MNRAPHHKRVAILRNLVEGHSIRQTAYRVGVAKNTVWKLHRDLDAADVIPPHARVGKGVMLQPVTDPVAALCELTIRLQEHVESLPK